MSVATLSSKFQISIPKEVRDAMQLTAGQKVVFLRVGNSTRLVPQRPLSELVGIARGTDTSGYRDRDTRREQGFARPAEDAKTRKHHGT